MTQLVVEVGADLRFDDRDLDDRAHRMLEQALMVVDPDDLDHQIIILRRASDRRLVIPRGFAYRLRKGLGALGVEVVWDDRRVHVDADIPSPNESTEKRDYQWRAIETMLATEQGIVKLHTGAGKSHVAALFVGRVRQRTLIIVDKINLASQFIDRIQDALGYQAGIIGDGAWDERDITVALRQSLWSRWEQLDRDGWFERWGVVFYDEFHQVSASTTRELLGRFPAYYRFGLSATPDRDDWLMIVGRATIGEVVYQTTDEELEAAGVLVRPQVIAIRSSLRHKWNRRGDTRREWTKLSQVLINDPSRNALIGQIMQKSLGRCVLVQTERLEHVDRLVGQAWESGWPSDSVLVLTGRQTREERAYVVDRASQGDSLVISTIGKEALDIPRLDTYIVAYPTKSQMVTRQMIGRVRRTHEDKTEAPIIYDVYDGFVPVLVNQFIERRTAYESERLPLRIIDYAVNL